MKISKAFTVAAASVLVCSVLAVVAVAVTGSNSGTDGKAEATAEIAAEETTAAETLDFVPNMTPEERQQALDNYEKIKEQGNI